MHFRHPKLFEHLGVTPIKGFLLFGPPGCGKTLLVHAIAGVSDKRSPLHCLYQWCVQELDIPFIELAGTEIIKGVSGESENTLRQLFQQAKVRFLRKIGGERKFASNKSIMFNCLHLTFLNALTIRAMLLVFFSWMTLMLSVPNERLHRERWSEGLYHSY